MPTKPPAPPTILKWGAFYTPDETTNQFRAIEPAPIPARTAERHAEFIKASYGPLLCVQVEFTGDQRSADIYLDPGVYVARN